MCVVILPRIHSKWFSTHNLIPVRREVMESKYWLEQVHLMHLDTKVFRESDECNVHTLCKWCMYDWCAIPYYVFMWPCLLKVEVGPLSFLEYEEEISTLLTRGTSW